MASYNIYNAPTQLSMNDFRSTVDLLGGPAKVCKYGVLISPSNLMAGRGPNVATMRDLTYLCEATQFPGRGFNMMGDIHYYGPNLKLPYQSAYEDISMTFICRNESNERELFDDWLEQINPSSSYDMNYRDDYRSQISLYKFNDLHIATYEFTLFDAFPIQVVSQDVTYADNDFLRLSVTFTYSKWRRRNKDPESNSYIVIA